MRIAFDGTTLTPGVKTGVGFYSEHLLRDLSREFPDTITGSCSQTSVSLHPSRSWTISDSMNPEISLTDPMGPVHGSSNPAPPPG